MAVWMEKIQYPIFQEFDYGTIATSRYHIVDISGRCQGQIKINIMPLEDLSRFRPRGVFLGAGDGGDAHLKGRLNPRAVYQTTALYEGVGFPSHVSRFAEQRIRLEPELSAGGDGGRGGRGGGGGGGGRSGGGPGYPGDTRTETNSGAARDQTTTFPHIPTSARPPPSSHPPPPSPAPTSDRPHSRVEFVAFEAPVRGPSAGDVGAKTMLQKSIGELDEITRKLKQRLEKRTDEIMRREGGVTTNVGPESTSVKTTVNDANPTSYPVTAAPPSAASSFDPTGPPLFMNAPAPLTMTSSAATASRPGPLGIWQRDVNYNSVMGRDAGGGEVGSMGSTTSLGLSSADEDAEWRGGKGELPTQTASTTVDTAGGDSPRPFAAASSTTTNSSSSSSSSRASSAEQQRTRFRRGVVDYSVSSGKDDDHSCGYPLNTNTNNENVSVVTSTTMRDTLEGEESGVKDDLREATDLVSMGTIQESEAVDAENEDASKSDFTGLTIDEVREEKDPSEASEIWNEVRRDEEEEEDSPDRFTSLTDDYHDNDFDDDDDDTTCMNLNDLDDDEGSLPDLSVTETDIERCDHLPPPHPGAVSSFTDCVEIGGEAEDVVEKREEENRNEARGSTFTRPYADEMDRASSPNPPKKFIDESVPTGAEGSVIRNDEELENHQLDTGPTSSDPLSDVWAAGNNNDRVDDVDEDFPCDESDIGDDPVAETEEDRHHVDDLMERVSSLLLGLSETVAKVGDISLGEVEDDEERRTMDDEQILGLTDDAHTRQHFMGRTG